MKRTLLAAALSILALPASANFSGLTDPSNWDTQVLGTLLGGGVGGSVTPDADTLLILGGNDDVGCEGGTYAVDGPCRIQRTINLSGSFTFDYDYATADSDGPAGDIFGVLVDGLAIDLSDPGGAVTQSGHLSFVAASSFGFFINCTDCGFGAATVRIDNFGFVPEPSALALLGAAGLGLASRRRSLRALRH